MIVLAAFSATCSFIQLAIYSVLSDPARCRSDDTTPICACDHRELDASRVIKADERACSVNCRSGIAPELRHKCRVLATVASPRVQAKRTTLARLVQVQHILSSSMTLLAGVHIGPSSKPVCYDLKLLTCAWCRSQYSRQSQFRKIAPKISASDRSWHLAFEQASVARGTCRRQSCSTSRFDNTSYMHCLCCSHAL